MEYYETIIVGGGPAGSSCAWQLKKHGREVLILDKQTFPRLKLCAGWITSKVMENLELTPDEYPHSILKVKTKMYMAPFPFSLGSWPTRSTDYSIRRIEFDRWLLERSQALVKTHRVRSIEKREDHYVIDGKYQCNYLVGAGGTGCPVRRILFPNQRVKEDEIVTLEKEWKYPQRDDTAYIFFCEHGLKGYSWYVPKGNGYLNIGLGGFSSYFKKSATNIHTHFQWFLENLIKRGLLDQQTAQQLKVQGHAYYLFTKGGEVKKNNCFLIGDSAGLATIDMGEGIGPAIESGLLAANEILGESQYVREKITWMSLKPFWQWLQRIWVNTWIDGFTYRVVQRKGFQE
jgi:flavin-dependent dehydrogenase